MADIILPETHYDAIIVGTGIEESLIAASLSRAGKRVLHLDLNESYGGHFSTVNPSELNDYVKSTVVSSSSHDEDSSTCSTATEPSSWYQNPFSQINFKIVDGSLNTSLQRKSMIDLCGLHLLYCRGPMVDLLIKSGIARYLEFRCLDSVLMFDKEHSTNPFKNVVKSTDTELSQLLDVSQLFQAVPTTKGEVFKTKFISLKEKNRLVKFIKFCVDLSTQEEEMKTYKEFENEPFDVFLSQTQLLGDEKSFDKLRDIVIHALALLDSPIGLTTQQVMSRVQYFISSLGRFGNGGAFLYPLYGQSELVQAFCRVGAVYGGVYVLRRGIHSVKLIENEHYQIENVNITTTDQEKNSGDSADNEEMTERPVTFSKEKVVIEVGSGVQTFTCDHLVMNRDSCKNYTSSNNDDLLLKFVVITESPLFSSISNTIAVVPSGTITMMSDSKDDIIVKQPCAIYISQFDYSSCVVPRGKYMISLQTRIPSEIRQANNSEVVEDVVTKMLQACANAFVKKTIKVTVENEEESDKENIVFSTLYKQVIRKGSATSSFSQDLDSKIHLCNDANHDVMQLESGMAEHVKEIFKLIAGEDVEFLAKIPDPNKSDRDEEDELYDETTKLLGIEKSKVTNTNNNDILADTAGSSGSSSAGNEQSQIENSNDEKKIEEVSATSAELGIQKEANINETSAVVADNNNVVEQLEASSSSNTTTENGEV